MMPTTAERLALRPEHLRRRLAPETLPFQTTAEVAPLEGTIGQPRALDAIAFGLEVGAPGYNLFVAGAPGSGRMSTIQRYLERLARTWPTPDDWVYVHNFPDPDQPHALRLPAGRGAALARDMAEFLQAAQREIPRAFDSEDYACYRRDALAGLADQRESLFQELGKFAQIRGFALEMTPAGIVTIPLSGGQPLAPEAFQRLPLEQRQIIERRGEELQAQVATTLRQVRQLDKAAAEKVRQLDRDVALFAVGPLFEDLRETYQDLPAVLAYVDQVQNDLPNHLDDFRALGPGETELPAMVLQLQGWQRQDHLARYQVNVLIDHSQRQGAPVVVERNPTYYNLVGRMDYRAAFGTMTTDFRQIKAGALHRANGSCLVLPILEVLQNPLAWDVLKRALLGREVRVENLGEQYSALPTETLRPEPIPLAVKVILIGSPPLYHLFYQMDEDFRELFKVKADFAPDMTWTDDHLRDYAAFISRCVQDGGLRHFTRAAAARVIEYGARLHDHQSKLSTRLLDIANLVTEASFWAGQAGHDLVQAEDVDHALAQKEYRSNLIEERIQELIAEGTILIETDGERTGQVNGLSIVDLGDYLFGHPSRVTARAALGSGKVQSIEREIELSGPIHSKGFLILAGYLAGRYAQDWPLAQGIAVTGSVNQHGQVQAVGGVTRKIEGFFAVCRARGLTGRQGVIIPAANVQNLMLSEEVVAAVQAGQFHIWAVRTIDEGIELLTGRPAGEREPDGSYPEGSVHRQVEERLRHYADQQRQFGASPDGRVASSPPAGQLGGKITLRRVAPGE